MENNESCGAGRSANSAYVLDNAGKEAPARFAALAAILDPGTIRHLGERGITSGFIAWRWEAVAAPSLHSEVFRANHGFVIRAR
jgi:hypothetical protein